MDDELTVERQLRVEIERLRGEFPDTQDLYREVCVLLFFRYGSPPTANRLYQLVRKGSMSAPATALAKFWEDLREKSRVRVEHPDLPEAIKTAAGDLVSKLWAQAQQGAQAGLAVFRADAQAAVLEAQASKAAADSALATAHVELLKANTAAEEALARTAERERELAVERAGTAALELQLKTATQRYAALEEALADSRHDFTAELEKLRQALQGAEERCEASEKRALLEIDRERTAAAKLQKELAQLRQSQTEVTERHRAELGKLQQELGTARQNQGVAEGTLGQMRATVEQQVLQLDALRTATSHRDTQIALLQRELNISKEALVQKDDALQKLRTSPATRAPKSKRSAENR